MEQKIIQIFQELSLQEHLKQNQISQIEEVLVTLLNDDKFDYLFDNKFIYLFIELLNEFENELPKLLKNLLKELKLKSFRLFYCMKPNKKVQENKPNTSNVSIKNLNQSLLSGVKEK